MDGGFLEKLLKFSGRLLKFDCSHGVGFLDGGGWDFFDGEGIFRGNTVYNKCLISRELLNQST